MAGQIDLLLPDQLRGFLDRQRQAARRIAFSPISRMDAIADMTRTLRQGLGEVMPDPEQTDHLIVIPQKEPGFRYVIFLQHFPFGVRQNLRQLLR